jgi:flavin reductase (DIM6/NTAB) family NADH-FMN oxidoreductase RutF
MSTFHVYEPRNGHGLAHDPLNSIVAPRPIGWISSLSSSGIRNLAPYSFFNLFNYTPPIIGFASIGWKDSVANIKATGEFAWNLVTRELADKMNATSAAVPATHDEFELAGLTPVASKLIQAPRVAESPVSFECRLSQLVRLTDSRHRCLADARRGSRDPHPARSAAQWALRHCGGTAHRSRGRSSRLLLG